ncbi:hypothetical protein LSTR_LSTR004972 [Laodelphax striatellus]|uniref:BTB domain-containing protein n=1 Tax=Laodelphax striatellus TaxID=195883 RepID=A0A482XN26_LAOST|nr:hypothetical protein LSTR_LSTR004972 [Laodelphax striatellus]
MCSKPQAPTPSNLKERFQRLFDSDLNSDCEFIVGPDKTVIKGHKVIFCTASDVFQAMFFGNLKEDSVRVEDLDPDGFRGMKTFIYTGEVSFTSVFHALSTHIASQKYMFVDLTVECAKYIVNEIQPLEVLEFLDLCLAHDITEFDDLCFNMIVEKTDEVLASDYLISTNIRTIEFILKSHSLKLNSEIELYDHFERWALAVVERQKIPKDCVATMFNDLKKHIRFFTMKSDDLVLKVTSSTLLTQEEKLAISLQKMKIDSNITLNTISITQFPRDFTKLLSIPKIRRIFYREISIDIEDRSDPQKIQYIKTNMEPLENHSCDQVLFITVHWSVHDEYICCEAQPNTNFMGPKKHMIIKTEIRFSDSNGCDQVFENESFHRNKVFQESVVLAMIPTRILESGDFYRDGRGLIDVRSRFEIDLINL